MEHCFPLASWVTWKCRLNVKAFLSAGLFQAAGRALGSASKRFSKKLLDMLVIFYHPLSPHLRPAAVAVLVAANAVEVLLGLTEADADMPDNAVGMFALLLADPQGQERFCGQKTVDRLISWIAKELLTVRHTLLLVLW
jgi:hypothetical protein